MQKILLLKKTVNQIGYPRWDKTIKRLKTSLKTSTVTTMSISNNKPSGVLTNTLDGSFDIYYVPFVRDSQNYVNASMIIKVSNIDTSVGYICDWQYQNKTYGSTNVSSTAESFAILFMYLEKNTLGHDKFNITDNNLFYSKNGEGKRTIGFKKSSANQNDSVKTNVLVADCIDYYVCNTPGFCNNQPGGCDYMNCSISPYCCYPVTDCIYWNEDDGGGGDDSNVDFTPIGSNNNSSGGGNSGGPTPPNPCGDNTPPTAAKTTNQSGISTMGLACNPTPGWTPISDDNTDNSYTIWDNQIKDSLVHPCMETIFQKLKSLQTGEFSKILSKFNQVGTPNWNWQIQEGILPSTKNGETNSTPNSYGYYVSTIDYNKLQVSTDLFIAKTMIHELIHAYLSAYFYSDQTKASLDYPLIFKEWQKSKYPNYNTIQHDQMAASFISTIAQALEQYGLSMNYQIDYQVYLDLAWGGLDYANNSTLTDDDKTRITNRLLAESQNTIFDDQKPLGKALCK